MELEVALTRRNRPSVSPVGVVLERRIGNPAHAFADATEVLAVILTFAITPSTRNHITASPNGYFQFDCPRRVNHYFIPICHCTLSESKSPVFAVILRVGDNLDQFPFLCSYPPVSSIQYSWDTIRDAAPPCFWVGVKRWLLCGAAGPVGYTLRASHPNALDGPKSALYSHQEWRYSSGPLQVSDCRLVATLPKPLCAASGDWNSLGLDLALYLQSVKQSFRLLTNPTAV